MLTSSAGAISKRRGITLLEMLIVVSLIGLLTAMSYAPVAAGVETLRLRAASDVVLSFLSAAVDRADRKQAVIEVQILPLENVFLARSSDGAFLKRVELPRGMRISRITPEAPGVDGRAVRRFLLYPGGAAPSIGVELINEKGRRRLITVDGLTGSPRAVEVMQ